MHQSSAPQVKCKICESESKHLFDKLILFKYTIGYYRCTNCEFIQTENPYWLDEAYSSSISDLDVGIAYRNLNASALTSLLFDALKIEKGIFLDYAGGTGLFTRLMRDKGYDFYRQDLYGENIFARHFDITDLSPDKQFDLTTAFEIFEHFADPSVEVGSILQHTGKLFFSTSIQPVIDLDKWWYLMTESGQHIAFYSVKSLALLADKLHCHFYTDHLNFHLFSKEKCFRSNTEFCNSIKQTGTLKAIQKMISNGLGLSKSNPRKSLIQSDFEWIKANKRK
jgi:hypothetical protein